MKTRDLAAVVAAILKIWPPLKTQYFYNFVIHVNICMKFCVLIVFYC